MALPVWKLSDHGQSLEVAPCTRSERLLAAAALGGLQVTPAGRKKVMLRLHGGYRPARASAHDGPAGVEALRSRPVA